MKQIKSFKNKTAVVALLLLLSGCTNEIEYPEGVDTLPSFSATGVVTTIYDTSAPPELTTTVPTTTSEITLTTTQTEETSDTQSETETLPTVTQLRIEDVRDVDISEYYQKTQTTPTVTEQITTEYPTATVTSQSIQTVPTALSETSIGYVTVSSDDESGVTLGSKSVDIFGTPINKQLTDGRISSYTGREIISHPYSYYTLDERYKKLYDKLVRAMLNCEDSITFASTEEVTFDDLFNVYQLIYNDEYRLFYISPTIEYVTNARTQFVTKMKPIYTHTADEVAEMREEIYLSADSILDQITPEMSDYEIVKLFHDKIILGCAYSANVENRNNVYGCLVNKEGLCQAYSHTFVFLCHQAGINALVVLGVANEPHMWNLVEMDGEYYHIDMTWDDPDNKRNTDSVRYDYFGLTDERIKELRQYDEYDYEVPAANGTKYQYYYYNNLVADSISEAQQIIFAEVIKAAQTKSSTVQIMCTDMHAFDEVTSILFGISENNLIGVLDSAKSQAANRYNTESIYHNSNENTLTIKIYLDYLD